MRALPPGSNRKPYTIYSVLKPINNVAASKIMSLFGEIGLGTQYELQKSVKSYSIWASGRGENRKMLKINELRTEEYCCQDEHLAILYFINRLSKMLKFSFE